MNSIFICYRNDGGFPTANHLVEKLEKDGYRVAFDKSSLRESGRFDERIKSQIESCTDFIVVLDKNALEHTSLGVPKETDWLRRELAYALEQGKNIIPIILPGFKWPDRLPDDIKDVRNHNGPKYSRDFFDGFYNELLSFLKSPHQESTRSESSRPIMSNIWKFATGLLALLLASIAIYYYYFGKDKESTLLFAGGGSVKGFITDSINKTAFDDGIYIPMASATVWPIVVEELSMGPCTIGDPRDYFFVILSAEKAISNIVVSNETRPVFLDKIGYITEIKLGESLLQVAYSKELDTAFDQQKPISSTELLNILNDTIINVFSTTKETSGTWIRYNSLFHSKLDDNKIKNRIKRYDKNDSPTYFASPYLILESAFYKANKIDDTLRRVNVWDDENNQLAACPMYIYFVVYKINNQDYYYVHEKVRSFLDKIGIIDFPKDGSISLMPKNDSLIRHYNQFGNRFEE